MSAETQVSTYDEDGSSLLAQVSNEMVRLYKGQFGRGPTTVRSSWAHTDVLVCVLEGTLTQAEENLLALGEHQRLRETRMFFQYAAAAEFCEPVERLTGRTVRAFVSGIDTEAEGISTETFVMYPRGSEGASRAAAAVV